jgi:hypothetical protein
LKRYSCSLPFTETEGLLPFPQEPEQIENSIEFNSSQFFRYLALTQHSKGQLYIKHGQKKETKQIHQNKRQKRATSIIRTTITISLQQPHQSLCG